APSARDAIIGAVAGVAGVVGLACFLRALSIGAMSIIAPISATGIALPVVVGVASGDQLSAIVAVGVVVALLGLILAPREPHEDAERGATARTSVVFALLAAIGFGSYFALADAAAGGGVWWLLATSRIVPVPVLALLAWRRRLPRPSRPRTLILMVA